MDTDDLELLMRWQEGCLDDAGTARLRERLADPRVAARLAEDCRFAYALGENLRQRRAGAALRRAWWRPAAAALAAAALLAIAVVGWHGMREPGFILIDGQQVTMERTGAPHPVAVGSHLAWLDTVITGRDGHAELATPDGSRLILAGGARVTLCPMADGQRYDLATGSLTCDVVPQPASRRFHVVTAQATITVQGTRFLVDRDGDATAVAVTAGAVQVRHHHDGVLETLAAGDSTLVRDARRPTAGPPGLGAGHTTRQGDPLRLRNASFEGTMIPWLSEYGKPVARQGDTPDGQWYAELPAGCMLRSPPFRAESGKTVHVSFWARSLGGGGKSAEVAVGFMPTQRDLAQRSKLYKNLPEKRPLSAEWKHHTVTLRHDLETSSQWPDPLMVLNLRSPVPMAVDGVAVSSEAPAGRRPTTTVIEMAAALTTEGLPADRLLAAGTPVTITASALNRGDTARSVRLRWRLVDEEGAAQLSEPIIENVAIPAGRSLVKQQVLKALPGHNLAEVATLDERGQIIDHTHVPVTVLPFPKAATRPDPAERIGCSLRGAATTDAARAIGFRWVRWDHGLRMGWNKQQPGETTFAFPDARVAELEGKGFAIDWLLWSDPPAWARAPANSPSPELPRDMADWKADDPRWQDLSTTTTWDRHIAALVDHYRGRAIAWELWNEPEFTKLPHEVYAELVKRTGRVLKRADPQATYLVNQIWPWPSPISMTTLKRGGAQVFDVLSYHNYGSAMSSPDGVANLHHLLAAHGSAKPRVWFNEGWKFIPTSHDHWPALQGATAAQCSHRLVTNTVELFAAGQEKTILFHIGYSQPDGSITRSYYDWLQNGGTELWDDHGDPTAAVVAWNVLADQLGLSQHQAGIHPAGAQLQVFADQRNRRGVVVAWATGDDPVELRIPLAGVVRRDVMGRDTTLPTTAGHTLLTLPGRDRPCYLFIPGTDAATWAKALAPLDRRVVEAKAAASQGRILHQPPHPWVGATLGKADGNPLAGDGIAPNWRLERVWPEDVLTAANHQPLVWGGGNWIGADHTDMGTPGAQVGRDRIQLTVAGARPGGGDKTGRKIAALSFIAFQDAPVTLSFSAHLRLTGDGAVTLQALHAPKGAATLTGLGSWPLKPGVTLTPNPLRQPLASGDRLVLVARAERMHALATVTLSEVKVSQEVRK